MENDVCNLIKKEKEYLKEEGTVEFEIKNDSEMLRMGVEISLNTETDIKCDEDFNQIDNSICCYKEKKQDDETNLEVDNRQESLTIKEEVKSEPSEQKRPYRKTTEENRIYKCSSCSYKCHRTSLLNKHNKTHQNITGMDIYTCSECEFKTLYRSSLLKHKLSHKDESEIVMFQCKLCPFKAKHKGNLAAHQQKRHRNIGETLTYSCTKCDFQSVYKRTIDNHMKNHTIDKSRKFACDQCGYRAKKAWILRDHKLVHLKPGDVGLELLKCHHCDYVTPRKKNMKEHVIVHMDMHEAEMFKCDQCSFKAKRKWDLKCHQKRHGAANTFKCAVCDFQTISRTAWIKHKLETHEKDNFEPKELEGFYCNLCEFQTTFKKNMEAHAQTHVDTPAEGVHKCAQCSYESERLRDFLRHEKRHLNGVKVHSCDGCDFKTMLISKLSRHKRETNHGTIRKKY